MSESLPGAIACGKRRDRADDAGWLAVAGRGNLYDWHARPGIVYMSARNFARYWHDDRINSVALYLRRTVAPKP